jgi:hypothetical protein
LFYLPTGIYFVCCVCFLLSLLFVFCQCGVDGDTTSLTVIAQALLKIQVLFGIIPTVRSKGHASRAVLQKLLRLRVAEMEQDQLLQQQLQQLQLTAKAGGGAGAGAGAGTAVGASGSSGKEGGVGVAAGITRRRAADKYNTRSEIDLLVV